MWDDGGQLCGAWPGTELTSTTVVDGKSYYTYTYTPDRALTNAMIIFNDGSRQTADLKLVPGGIYNASGMTGQVSGVESTVSGAELRIGARDGMLVVDADRHAIITVVSLDGMARKYTVRPGRNTIELPRGFYIVEGRKVIL